MKNSNWYHSWFDSKFYHLLYSNRNETEAKEFINQLYSFIGLNNSSLALDLACGKGRHSKYIHKKGASVIGVDLSKESIKYAKQFETKNLKFEVADMRNLPFEDKFDCVFNLFTSFGYFKNEEDNLQVIQQIYNALKQDGILVLDYLNVKKGVKNLPQKEIIKREEILFHISKKETEAFIEKEILFEEDGEQYSFYEYVKLIYKQDFEKYLKSAGFELLNFLGDYDLNPFDEDKSERLIIIAQKR